MHRKVVRNILVNCYTKKIRNKSEYNKSLVSQLNISIDEVSLFTGQTAQITFPM